MGAVVAPPIAQPQPAALLVFVVSPVAVWPPLPPLPVEPPEIEPPAPDAPPLEVPPEPPRALRGSWPAHR